MCWEWEVPTSIGYTSAGTAASKYNVRTMRYTFCCHRQRPSEGHHTSVYASVRREDLHKRGP